MPQLLDLINLRRSERYAREGRTQIPEPHVNETFSIGLCENRFLIYDYPVAALKDSFFKMICVPVMAENANANLQAVENVASNIAMGLKRGDVVALTPSVPPGTTEDFVLPILEREIAIRMRERFFCSIQPREDIRG